MHNLQFNKNNSINITSQSFYLRSNNYIIMNCIVLEESIPSEVCRECSANLMTSILTEYRNILSPDLYIHSILDYAYYQDGSTDLKDTLLGIGLGNWVILKNGLLKHNGTAKNRNKIQQHYSSDSIQCQVLGVKKTKIVP
jgi:hypothetical protein